MKATYFKSAEAFRRWLAANHAKKKELLVGFYKKASGRPGISYKDAVDEALCFGWIDGVKRGVDDERYTHRFSPRRSGSIWSLGNFNRMKQLIALRRAAAPGLDAFERRDPKKTGVYSFENRPRRFEPALAREFRAHEGAWTFFRAQPAGYQRLMTFFVMSAKQPETRQRRLATLIKSSAEGKRLR